VILTGAGPPKTSRATPPSDFTDLSTLCIKLRRPFPVATFKNYSQERPGMIMYIIRIRLQKLVYKDVEGKSIPILKEHIVAFQVRFVFHTVHDHTVPTPTLKEFFKHSIIIQEKSMLVKKKPYPR
jgi:hypothetical protein